MSFEYEWGLIIICGNLAQYAGLEVLQAQHTLIETVSISLSPAHTQIFMEHPSAPPAFCYSIPVDTHPSAMYVVDVVLNFETLMMPWLRCLGAAAALTFLILTQVRTDATIGC